MSVKKEQLGCVQRDWFVKVCSPSSCENKDEDLRVIDVTPIESVFQYKS